MHAFDRQTDGRTDRIPIAILRLHSMQRGKKHLPVFYDDHWRLTPKLESALDKQLVAGVHISDSQMWMLCLLRSKRSFFLINQPGPLSIMLYRPPGGADPLTSDNTPSSSDPNLDPF